MGDKCGSGSVSDRSFAIPRSDSKVMVGEKRGRVEVGEKSDLGHKRVKVRDLEFVFRSEGTIGSDASQQAIGSAAAGGPLDLNAETCVANNFPGDDTPECVDDNSRLSSPGKHERECNDDHAKSTDFGLYINPKGLSRSTNHDPFYPYKNNESLKLRDDLECGSSIGPLEEKDPMRIWKEMKQNGFLSSSHGGVPMPKPRGRKSKSDGLKKKMELAKKEQVDRFAKIAAPSGLLNGLNPGIINHVRNSKQVHSIIENLVRSEKLEHCHAGSKQPIQTKSGKEESRDRNKDLENTNGSGMNRFTFRNEDGYNLLSGSKRIGVGSISMNKSVSSNSELTRGDGDLCMVEGRIFGRSTHSSISNPGSKDDILALKLSSSTIASENTSSLSNEDSANLSSVTSLSVKAANVASQWLELLHQDIKGRLAALRRSRKRVRAVIHTELPFLMLREFSSNQENDLYATKSSANEFSSSATADVHQARWSALFDQMDKSLSEEEKQMENWLKQVKEMQLHCERGLFQYNAAYGLQQLGALGNDYR
ncbi:unnamed protein product [Ilex paraguariensis]|uniref:Cation-transporting ATPase n=1 Tax=Ilex paraguariensis TaxID=185542 RepID=A0ABC8QM38_9AQUA